MSLADWLEDVNKRHSNINYASKDLDKEFERIKRRRSKSLGSVVEMKIEIPNNNHNKNTNNKNKWNLNQPSTPTKRFSSTTPSTPTSLQNNWTTNRVVGSKLNSPNLSRLNFINRSIPSPSERGIPSSPKNRYRFDNRNEYPGFKESIGRIDFKKKFNKPVNLSEFSKNKVDDVFGVVLHSESSPKINEHRNNSGINNKNVLGSSLGISVDVKREADTKKDVNEKINFDIKDVIDIKPKKDIEYDSKRPKMRLKEPNVLKRWQFNLNEQQQQQKQQQLRKRNISPSLRSIKAKSMSSFNYDIENNKQIYTPIDDIRQKSDGKLDLSTKFTPYNELNGFFNDSYNKGNGFNKYMHANNNNNNNVKDNDITDTYLKDNKDNVKDNEELNYFNNHKRSTSTPSSIKNITENENENTSEMGGDESFSQSSLIELDVDEETTNPQFNLFAVKSKSDIFYNNEVQEQQFPKLIAPKPIHVNTQLGTVLGRIEEEANVPHRQLPTQPSNTHRQPSNRPLPIPSSQASQKAPSRPSPLNMNKSPKALPHLPQSVGINNNVTLRPKRIYKPSLKSKGAINNLSLSPPSASYTSTPPPS